MKLRLCLSIVFLSLLHFCKAQDSTVVLSTSMFDINFQSIELGNLDGWIFKPGNDTSWAKGEIDTTGWKRLKPTELTAKNTDKNGRAEGWFRLRFRLDTSFNNMPIGLKTFGWAANDVYINGTYIGSGGSTGKNEQTYKEHPLDITPPYTTRLQPGVENVLAVHLVDCRSSLKPTLLKSEMRGGSFIARLTGPETNSKYIKFENQLSRFWAVMTSVVSVLTLLFWFLYIQNRTEKVLITISITSTFFCVATFFENSNTIVGLPFIQIAGSSYLKDLFYSLSQSIAILFMAQVFRRRVSYLIMLFVITIAFARITDGYFFNYRFELQVAIYTFSCFTYLVATSWKNLKGAQWVVVAGILSTFICYIFYGYNAIKYAAFPFPFAFLYLGCTFLLFPLSQMIYVALRFREILFEVRQNAAQVLQMSEEKKEHAIRQQEVLKEEVAKQTVELRAAFDNLKSTQAQLIQSEKMASLGELTAGIAHEIQNPLNFVNNFSEVNRELIQELKSEILSDNKQEAISIANDIDNNEEKINHHGKRADAIVKGMLQHSRKSEGTKEPTDINALCDEYLRLSYHGLRAKDKNFNATLKTDFDESISSINIIPQDIGRVLLNLINNAFYAVNEKSKHDFEGYEPTVSVSTKKMDDKVLISVRDNGPGIPQKVVDKIFQPFFTTKPRGQGTGLGLSLSYDIIKAHGGEIKVETKEKEGTEFIILLPGN